MAKVVVELRGERLGNGYGVLAQRNMGLSGGLRYRGGWQGGDFGQGLGVEQQQEAGDSIGQGFRVAGEEFLDPGQPLVLGDVGVVLPLKPRCTAVLILLLLAQTKNVRILCGSWAW